MSGCRALLGWTRPPRKCDDPGKMGCLAKRYQEALALAINEQPMQIEPRALGISKINRLFNVHQVHGVILRSMLVDGHDPTRPHVGICVELTDPAERKALVEHNKHLSDSSPMLPPVHADLMRYECLDATHYNVALRLGKANAWSPEGDLAAMRRTQESFNDACERGHWWIVLPGTLAMSLKVDVCTWRNQDQNENQPITDGEIVRLAEQTVQAYLVACKSPVPASMSLAEVVKGTCLRTPLRINPAVVGGYARFVCQMAEERKMPLVEHFLSFWTCNVNCRELASPHSFFDVMGKTSVLKGKPQLRLSLAMAMYAPEAALPRTRPTPDQCNLFTSADLSSLERMPFVAELAEKTLDNAEKNFFPLLFKGLTRAKAESFCVQLRVLLARATFSKSLGAPGLPPTEGVTTGKVTDTKVKELLGIWAKHIDAAAPELLFGKTADLEKFYPVVVTKAIDIFTAPEPPVEVCLRAEPEPSSPAALASRTGEPGSSESLAAAPCRRCWRLLTWHGGGPGGSSHCQVSCGEGP